MIKSTDKQKQKTKRQIVAALLMGDNAKAVSLSRSICLTSKRYRELQNKAKEIDAIKL